MAFMDSSSKQVHRGNLYSMGKSKQTDTNMAEVEGDFQKLVDDMGGCIQNYSAKHPAVLIGAVFWTGFYVGWKVKPW